MKRQKIKSGETIGVIGCGNMGSALLKGMVRSRRFSPQRVLAWDPDSGRLATLVRSLGIRKVRSNREIALRSQTILLAVKPQQMERVLQEIRPYLRHRPLIVSIAAGIPIRWIEKEAGSRIPVVRVMPNTPALVGAGISALAKGRAAKARDLAVAENVFQCVGQTLRVPESWMDAVTAVSGSGPAYFFYLMEQMIGTGIRLGLSPEAARHLVLQTAVGAAKLACQSGESPEVLRARVTSKGGTTEAAFREFEKRRLGKILEGGIQAAARRSKQGRSILGHSRGHSTS